MAYNVIEDKKMSDKTKDPFEITKLSETIVCSNCGCTAEAHPRNVNSVFDHWMNGTLCYKSQNDVVNEYVAKLEGKIK
jgi:hypothetical protein